MKMIKFKALIIAFSLSMPLFFASSARAQGIPVIDVANLAQAIQDTLAWYQQYQQMYQQLQLTLKQLENASGNRGFGTINNAIKNSVVDPAFLQKLQTSSPAQSRALIQDQLIKITQSTNTRFSQIQQLMAVINQTNDLKGVNEIVARIQAEQAMIQLEAQEVQTLKSQYEARVKQFEQESNTKIRQAALQGGYNN